MLAEGLKEYFAKFGEIAEVMVMKDPTTRRSRYYSQYQNIFQFYIFLFLTMFDNLFLACYRGFGFVTFSDVSGVDKVLEHGTHDLDGKKVRHLYGGSFIDRFLTLN